MTIRASLAALAAALLLSACTSSTPGGADEVPGEPALQTDPAKLAAGLDCTDFTHPDKPAVLLVHGTFTAGFEQYEWTYKPLLVDRGYDVCTVTYPDRGLGDMQTSAEYVVYALREMRLRSGRKVAMIGHSQGVAVPRWAIKWWPSARNAVDDFVMQAGPNYGISIARLGEIPLLPALVGLPEVFYQFGPNSAFMQATNRGDQTPGDLSYTAMYSQFDELVRPVETAAIEPGQNNPKVTNILIQDICPARIVEHATIGLIDAVAFNLALDAIEHPGPANVERAGGAALCGLLPIVPNLVIPSLPDLLAGLITIAMKEPGNGLPGLHLAPAEPELRDYAR